MRAAVAYPTCAAQGPCSSSSNLLPAASGIGWEERRPLQRPRHCRRLQVASGLSYKDAGVDIDAGNELVKRIQKLNPNIGGFSGMVAFGRHNPGWCSGCKSLYDWLAIVGCRAGVGRGMNGGGWP